MLPPSHLLTLVPNRALAAAKRLEAAIWTDARPLECHATEPSPQLVSLRHAPNLPTRKIEPGTRWGKLYDSRWYRLDFPPADDNTWLTLREQSEATLYVAGQPRFGLDVAHRHGRLPEGTTQAWIQSIAIQSAIWHHQRRSWSADGCEFVGVWLVRRDEAAWDGYHDLQCLIDLMLEWRKAQDPATENPPSLIGYQGSIAIAPPEYRRLLRRLDQACDALERRGVSAMRDVLATAYDELRADRSLLRCIATGHAHIDLVWLWPERIGEMKAVHTFANVDALMNDYPEFRFAYSQPASYEAVKRREPELFGRVKNRIDTGRWQATGAMYVESDTMMPCGEALARSFEIGQRAFTDLRGEPSPLVWLPDVFGYSACLPQIMKLNGIKYFFTTKMTWNAINRFPHSSFNWQGHDGSTVLAHVIQDTIGYNGTLHVPQLRATMLTHQQADVHGEYLMPSGYGDGGGGPTRLICERARRLNRMHTMPEIAWDHPEAFFDRLAPLADQLPTHEGECYLEFHRGIFTTHRRLKHAFRSMECALQVAEAISSRTGESIDLEHAWKRAIFSQFHDYIPGSSVWDVYAEGLPELEELAEDLTRGSAKLLAASEGQPCVFNPHAVPVVHLVDDGQASIVLAPLSGSSLDDAPRDAAAPVTRDGRTVSNGLTSFTLGDDGTIADLCWPEGAAALCEGFAGLVRYPDVAANFDAWDLDRHTLSVGEPCDGPADITPFDGPDGAAGWSVRRTVGDESSVDVRLFLKPVSAELHIEILLDWRDPEAMLKLHLPTRYRARQARFGAPFGSVLRSQVPDGPVSAAMWEVPFSRHLSVFEEGETRGMAVIAESLYGASVYEGAVGLTLIRSPRVTGREGMHCESWPPALSRISDESPVFSDLGEHTIRLALSNVGPAFPASRHPAALCDTLFTAPCRYVGSPLEAPFTWARLDPTVVPAWVKPLNGGSLLVRLHEANGKSAQFALRCHAPYRAAIADFAGQALGDLAQTVTHQLSPYEIATVRLDPS